MDKLHKMMQEEPVPCRRCKDSLHRGCTNPTPIPTILSYLSRPKHVTSETVTCCDRKEFWSRAVYPWVLADEIPKKIHR